VAVSKRSYEYEDVTSISNLRPTLTEQITEFIALYNKNSGKQDKVTGTSGPERAVALLEQASDRFFNKQ
jgi:inorganic pyrophosphatase